MTLLIIKFLSGKLYDYGIRNHTLKWFVSYLDNRAQRVNINSSLSDSKCINIGVPQGSILGPLLFIIHVDSMPNSVSCKCVMYADDTTLLCSSSDSVTLKLELDKNMSNSNKWFHDNKLSLDVKKTKFMVFGTNYVLSIFDGISLSHANSVIEKVDKYFVVTLDPNLTWYNHVTSVSSNVTPKRIGIIRRLNIIFHLKCCICLPMQW